MIRLPKLNISDVSMLEAMPEVALIVGRFQGLHQGHVWMIEQALRVAKHVVILVGSAQESVCGNLRNPFGYADREVMLKEALHYQMHRISIFPLRDLTETGDDDTFRWGDHVLSRFKMHTGLDAPNIIFTGQEAERQSWYNPDEIPGTIQMTVPRSVVPISATQMRQFIIDGKFSSWMKFRPNYLGLMWWHRQSEILRDIIKKQEEGNSDESTD